MGLILAPFFGRIGFTNGKPGQVGDFYLDDYAINSVDLFGDTQLTDFRQRGEIRSIVGFCLLKKLFLLLKIKGSKFSNLVLMLYIY